MVIGPTRETPMGINESIDRWWHGRTSRRHDSGAEVIMDSGYAQIRENGIFRYLCHFVPFCATVAMGRENRERHAMRASEANRVAHALNTKNIGLIRFRSLRVALDNVVGNCGIWPCAARESSWTPNSRRAHAGRRMTQWDPRPISAPSLIQPQIGDLF
jgi:hypothetical protein